MSTVSKRLISLDALRGFTIAGMILVNVPGSWSHIYPPFRHAHFNGLTLADLVFPFFLFIVGASIVLALGKRMERGDNKKKIMGKILYRSLVIFILGVFLNWLSSGFDFPLRIAGVLQRIALCYLLGSILFIYTSRIVQMTIAVTLLLGYWIITIFTPIPGEGRVFSFEMNWTAWIDSQLLPGVMYFKTWDPEGLFSTLPSVGTTLIGIILTQYLQKLNKHLQKARLLLLAGAGLTIAGLLLSASFPINKNVWSSSFVLVTAGLASLVWGTLVFLIDHRGYRKFAQPGVVFGANAITAYVLHYILHYPLGRWKLGGASIQTYFMDFFSGFFPPELASLLWAIFFVAICFIPILWMYRRKMFLKV